MQKKKIAGFMTALIISSCLLTFSPNNEFHAMRLIDKDYSPEGSNAEIKIHRPGEMINSTETLSWYPNNISDYSTIQFTVILHNGLLLDNIANINITGSWLTDDGLSIEQFNLEITQFSDDDLISPSRITRNYTYPNTVWAGNYSLTTEITQKDGMVLSIERSDLKFIKFGYLLSYNKNTSDTYLCSCDRNIIPLKLTNTGADNKMFTYSLDLNLSSFNLEWVSDSSGNSSGELIAGESVNLYLSVELNTDFIHDEYYDIPIYLEIEYEGDRGQRIFLSQQPIYVKTTVLEDGVSPYVDFSFANTNYKATFFDTLSPLENLLSNTTVFSYGQDFILFKVSLANLGYYNRDLRIEADNPHFNYTVLYNQGNYSLSHINDNQIKVDMLEHVDFDILVGNISNHGGETVTFDFIFDDSISTLASFTIAPKPVVTEDVLITTTSYDSPLSLPINYQQTVQINLTDYLKYVTFDNRWLLECNYPMGVLLTDSLSGDEYNNQGIVIELEDIIQSLLNSQSPLNFEFTIEIAEEFSSNIALIEFNLIPIIPGLDMTPWHNTSITVLIDAATNETDGAVINDDEVGNNTDTTDNDATNNTTGGDNNSTVDNDSDGVIDSLDACPNTASGVTVDEFGCQVIEQDLDDGQDDVTDNSTSSEGSSIQETDTVATQTDENNVVKYLIIGSIAMAIVGALLFLNSRRSGRQTEPSTKTVQPIMPPPALPMPSMETVVLQQWTDANGYSWRQMSDQSIMWWNGSDWIHYGKN